MTGRTGSEMHDRGHTVGAGTPNPVGEARDAALYAAWWVLHHIPADAPPTRTGRVAGHTTARTEILAGLLDELGLNGRPVRLSRQVRRDTRSGTSPELEDI